MQHPNDDEILVELVNRFPQGASLEEVMLGIDPHISRRTLQRRLANLVKKGELIALGKGRARRYQSIKQAVLVQKETAELPLSTAGERVQLLVSQPIQSRTVAIYHREFLEKYIPNETWYLPKFLREKLAQLGGSKSNEYPAGTYARRIFNRLLIDLSWNSSRLEGNTYSLLETERLLELGEKAPGKDLKETQMILNHKTAIEFLISMADQIAINRYTILNLHALLSDNLLVDPSAAGRVRSIPVGIAHSVYQPLDIFVTINECFDLLLEKAQHIEDPFEQAFFLLVQIPYLQPFDDVNKRTSRLAANIPLIKNNLCPVSFIDVPEKTYINGLLGVYEFNKVELLRDVFEWAYFRSCALYAATRATIGEPDIFRFEYRSAIQNAVQAIVRQLIDKKHAPAHLRQIAERIPEADRSRFIEWVERELQGLHEGNIARYQLHPKEYEQWKAVWVKIDS